LSSGRHTIRRGKEEEQQQRQRRGHDVVLLDETDMPKVAAIVWMVVSYIWRM
jgi:hypothetical protein